MDGRSGCNAPGRSVAGNVILVDSSVWIDFFRGTTTAATDALNGLLLTDTLAIGDLILTEVLQGFESERDFRTAQRMLGNLDLVVIGGADVMIEAARNYRLLRERGVTVRKTIDTLIATRCIVDDLVLLHDDRDFDPFTQYLGLRAIAL